MGHGTKSSDKGRMSRAERLAAQLRENLKRRKTQERARGATAGAKGTHVVCLDPATQAGDRDPEEH